MGTHPIFESDFDCLTEMRFSQVLARAVRTEYRTPVMKHPYQPGKTFGYMSSATPAYLFAGACILGSVIELAYQSIKSWKELLPDHQLPEELNLVVNQIWILLTTVVESGSQYMLLEDRALWKELNLLPLIQC